MFDSRGTSRGRAAGSALVLLAALSVAACGGGQTPADRAEPGGAGGATPPVVVVAQSADPTTMDPQDHRETPTANVLRHIYDPLMEPSGDDLTQFDPILAESWEFIEPTVLEVRLRRGITFHNGEPFNAEVVKYNIDRVTTQFPGQDAETLVAYRFTPIAGAEVVDEYTVRIRTHEPDPLLISRLGTLLIVPMEYTRDRGFNTLAREPVGTGPYTFVEWTPNQRVVLEANQNYHLGPPRIDRVEFRPMPEVATRLTELRAGNVDIIVGVPADNIQEIEATPGVSVASVPSARVAFLFLNTLDFDHIASPLVRRALNHAVDVDAIIEHVMGGHALRVATSVPPYFTGHNPDLKPYAYDPDLARRLLAEAGYPDGFSMRIMVPQGRYQMGVEATMAIAGYLEEVGIRTSVDVVEFGHFAQTTQQRVIDEAFYGAWGNELFHPLDSYGALMKCGTDAFSWYCSPEADELARRAATTVDPEEHVSLLQDLERVIYEDPPFLFLYAQEDLYGVSDRLVWEPRSDELIYMYEAEVRP